MRRAFSTARTRAALLAVVVAGCGPYANVAQKLDVTARVAGDTWIARGGPWETRVLVVGKPDVDGRAPFSFSSLYVPVSAGKTVSTLQGTWTEVGSSGTTTLSVQYAYTMPDESNKYIWNRQGTSREDVSYTIQATVARSAGQLVVAGDARIAGTYVPLVEALANVPNRTPSEAAACAFQVANVGMLRSEGRIIGFGGPLLAQYQQAATYVGTVAGSLTISMSLSGGFSHSTTTIHYGAFEDIGGVVVDGPMVTDANDQGDGQMSGTMTFAFEPVAADGTPGAPIEGTIDYGANAIQISNGNPIGGSYTVAIQGGGTALVPCAEPPSPSVWDCLALP
jgi:hypothetical protein